MTTVNWQAQVEGQLGRPMKFEELEEASRDFAAMGPVNGGRIPGQCGGAKPGQ